MIFSFTTSISSNFEFFLQLTISAILGFIIGLDREYKSKPAGVKTFMYVSVACTLLTIISIESVTKFGLLNDLVRMDPLRLAAQIVSGLGFLGAGVILKDGLKIRGLTSAAMILFAGGIGIGIGAGFYGIVVFAMIFSMILARIADRLEKRLRDKMDVERVVNKKKINNL